QHVMEGDGLELTLRAVADQSHDAAFRSCHAARCQSGGCRGPQCRGQCQLGNQQRIAGRHIRKDSERRDSQQTNRGVLGMAVDVLESIELTIRGRHELDDAHRRMRRMAGRLGKLRPAQIIRLDLASQLFDKMSRAHSGDDLPYALNTNEVDHDCSPTSGPGLRDEAGKAGPLAKLKWCDGAWLKSSQKTAHKCYKDDQNAR